MDDSSQGLPMSVIIQRAESGTRSVEGSVTFKVVFKPFPPLERLISIDVLYCC